MYEPGCWNPIELLDVNDFNPSDAIVLGKEGGTDHFDTAPLIIRALSNDFMLPVIYRSMDQIIKAGYSIFFVLPETGYKTSLKPNARR